MIRKNKKGAFSMSVMKEIAERASARAAGLTVEELCIGVGYSVVKLSDGSAGAAYTFRRELGESCGVLPGAGRLNGTEAGTLLDWADSRSLARSALAVATVNALLNRDYERGGNIVHAVECGETETVGMVGWFCPLVNRYSRAAKLYIFEKALRSSPLPDNTEAHGEEEETALLPHCDQVVLTGTAFINSTADALLEASRNARELVIVGASTPMCPEVLGRYGVTVLAGTRILDADMALRIVAQGGGGMDLSPASAKLLERIPRA